MPDKIDALQKENNRVMNRSLNNAYEIITKEYLEHLEEYRIIKPSEEDLDIDIAECGKFYKLTKLVMNREEKFLNKLTTIVNVALSIDCSIATIIKSDGFAIEYYFGIVSKNARDSKNVSVKRRMADAAAFKGALQGNLIGSELSELSQDEVSLFRDKVLLKKKNCYSAVSGIVALRDEEEKNIESYVQGIENLVDSLKGQLYTIVMIADPVSASEIQVIKQGYEMLHTQLSTFAKTMVTLNESDTLSLSKSQTTGFSEGITKGISMTQSKTRTKGRHTGTSVNAGGSISITPFGIGGGVNVGTGSNTGKSSSIGETTGKTNSNTKNFQKNKAETEMASSSKTTGKSLQLNYENRTVKSLLDKIDKHLERLDECESFGAFDCAAYVIAGDRETALAVASNYNALMRGRDSSVQASHINSWFKPEETEILGKYIGSLAHPRFMQNEESRIIVTPASVVSGDELAIQIGLPKKSIAGVTVIPMAPFGRNVMEPSDSTLELGTLYHMGHNEGECGREQKVRIDIESLAMHTFITGSTGKGKSTAIYSVLDKLMQTEVKGKHEKIKFMVIEPAKGEYKDRFGNDENVNVYGTNAKKTPLLRINPFSFPEDIHVLEHIDRMIEIFNVCWPMYAAMPAVLKDAIERAYVVSGWDLESSQCRYVNNNGEKLFPSFVDVLKQINMVMDESAYSADSKGDYKGALCTRIKSLTNGLYGQIFTNDELAPEELFDQNVIIDLSRTGSSETKALIMGLLVIKLQEHRMAGAVTVNAPLQHITVLEEAHNILKRTSTEQTSEGANMLGKSVEMLANSIAEMRTYGEGFVIADQAPGLMDMSVIRNTNTKIILGLPDLEDRKLVGKAAGLNDDQIVELSRLKTFVAAVYQNNWLEPVLCNIDTNFKEIHRFSYHAKREYKADKKRYIDFLLLPLEKRVAMDKKYIDELVDGIFRIPVSSETKAEFIRFVKTTDKEEVQRLRGQIIYSFFNSETVLGLAKDRETNIEGWYEYVKDALDPSAELFDDADQKKIITLIAMEKMEADRSKDTKELFERLINFM